MFLLSSASTYFKKKIKTVFVPEKMSPNLSVWVLSVFLSQVHWPFAQVKQCGVVICRPKGLTAESKSVAKETRSLALRDLLGSLYAFFLKPLLNRFSVQKAIFSHR